jgi:hypothetical protein
VLDDGRAAAAVTSGDHDARPELGHQLRDPFAYA